ncbi:Myb-like DNA-binding domain containing protein [Tritrichomonas foetus]|uniref:Myb-like DNA-binding domain containing protein n=1 Tax=Tritrichomonas foetus TaxID=1144522 RepID=A0A1J4JCF0_9EUKA|nr:Myb-like DNA-binding domain containing protein [Tritrichomonas foetus]|eukprot:OHS96337.1 Myb-like DNA-binding domain containing protein [Tritrichomonas foetus]
MQYQHIQQQMQQQIQQQQQQQAFLNFNNNLSLNIGNPYQTMFFGNNATKIMKQRNRFTKEEDDYLKYLVEEDYFKNNNHTKICLNEEPNWNEIAVKMIGRTARQCRERYRNYLQPGINNGPWSQEEEELLEQKYREFGPQWCKLVKFFPNRSDVNIKNHYTCLLNRQSRINFINSSNSSSSAASVSNENIESSPLSSSSSYETSAETTRNVSPSESISSLNVTSMNMNYNERSNNNNNNNNNDKNTKMEENNENIEFNEEYYFFPQQQFDENNLNELNTFNEFNENVFFDDPFYSFDY